MEQASSPCSLTFLGFEYKPSMLPLQLIHRNKRPHLLELQFHSPSLGSGLLKTFSSTTCILYLGGALVMVQGPNAYSSSNPKENGDSCTHLPHLETAK
ncbi:hypothetical protein F2Q69_00016162 [Brassica cretica]|uniref:Uncharacterized protein n=1 Tax=Brassica cretica TaxID=69181 RepID=A0A8S9QTF9_BRACR|nr:hypothetical protein F2Q69_00016162 [Brassica cretica]